MNTEEALEFLQSHQPFGQELYRNQSMLDRLAEVIRHFRERPDKRCIRPMLLAMGGGDGCGLYKEMGDVLFEHFAKEDLLPTVKEALHSQHERTQYWALEFSWDLRDRSLLPDYLRCLRSSSPTIRESAALGVHRIAVAADRGWIEDAIRRETDEDVSEALRMALERIEERERP